jgi:hypothetical protein
LKLINEKIYCYAVKICRRLCLYWRLFNDTRAHLDVSDSQLVLCHLGRMLMTKREGLNSILLDGNPPILTIALINYFTHRNYFGLIYSAFERVYQIVLLYLFRAIPARGRPHSLTVEQGSV